MIRIFHYFFFFIIEYQRGSKLSNLEIQRTGGLLSGSGLERPASYAPVSAAHSDPLHSPHQINLLNNLDTLRSYGSAGIHYNNFCLFVNFELNIIPIVLFVTFPQKNKIKTGDDLENIPPDYLRNLNIDPVQNNAVTSSSVDADLLHKPSWSEQMHLQSFQDNRIKNGKILALFFLITSLF